MALCTQYLYFFSGPKNRLIPKCRLDDCHRVASFLRHGDRGRANTMATGSVWCVYARRARRTRRIEPNDEGNNNKSSPGHRGWDARAAIQAKRNRQPRNTTTTSTIHWQSLKRNVNSERAKWTNKRAGRCGGRAKKSIFRRKWLIQELVYVQLYIFGFGLSSTLSACGA